VDLDVSDAVIIQVLLVLIRHPGSRPADVVRRLRGHDPPIIRPHEQPFRDAVELHHRNTRVYARAYGTRSHLQENKASRELDLRDIGWANVERLLVRLDV
jgi:hypothetical protein